MIGFLISICVTIPMKERMAKLLGANVTLRPSGADFCFTLAAGSLAAVIFGPAVVPTLRC